MRDVYSEQANQWWDQDGAFKMLHRMHAQRLALIQKNISEIKGKKVLDYACGGGLLAESLTELGASVVGVDTSQPSIDAATKHAQTSGYTIDYICGDIDDLDDRYFSQSPFDIICAMECLEHVQHPQRLISCFSSCLEIGGYAVFSTINRNIYGYCLGIIAAEYLLGWVEPGTHDYQLFIRPSELVRMCMHANLELQVLQGLSFDMRTQTFSISNDVSLNYMAVFKKLA